MKKYGYWLLCSIVLFVILLLCARSTSVYTSENYPFEFSIEQNSCNVKITIHESDDGTYHVFLPSYAELDAVKIVMSAEQKASLGEALVTNGMYCGDFEFETAYPLIVDDQYLTDLVFYRSANVATLHVDTLSGSMRRVRKDKNQSEQANVLFYTADGVLDVSDSSAYIKGRGNYTWDYFNKRPYILTLSSDADVLDMGAAKKWILLANATDPTNLKNKLVLDLARETGQGWSPECRFVDVYLNGEYAGLYLLTEKVEAGPSRLPLDPHSGDFLCKIDWEERWNSLKDPVKTQLGRTVEISSPDSVDNSSGKNILAAINQMEQIILSGSDLAETESFDLDSWVQRYLLDEISGNIDADMVSSYFYFRNGTFYAGPVWDYDMTFGNAPRNRNPRAFVAKNPYKIDNSVSYYYAALYANESFYCRMVEYYESEFLPILNRLTEFGIADMAAQIQSAAKMDDLRWPGLMPGQADDIVRTVEDLISYLEDRVSFLNGVWLDGAECCTLQFKLPKQEEYWNFTIRKGELLEDDDLNLKDAVWVDRVTGDIVDLDQPVMSDGILVQQDDFVVDSKSIGRDTIELYMIVLSSAMLAAFFLCMIWIDASHRRKERSAPDE